MGKKVTYEQLEDQLQSLKNEIANNQQIVESGEKYKNLIKNIPGMIYRGGADWSTTIITNCKDLCGYDTDEFIRKYIIWSDLIHKDDIQRVFDEAEKISKASMSIVQEYRIVDKSESVKWVSDHKRSNFNQDGVFTGVDGVVFDITDRKKMEQELHNHRNHLKQLVEERSQELLESELRYKTIFNAISDSLLISDSKGKIEEVNPTACKTYGYSKEEFLKLHVKDIIQPEYYSKYKDFVAKTLLNEIYRDQTVDRKKDGSHIQVDVTASKVEFKNKLNYVAVIRDIIESKKMQTEIEKSEYRYRYLIATMQEGLVEVDPSWRILFINECFANMIGYQKDQVIGKHFYDFVDQADIHDARKQLDNRHKGKTEHYELQLVRSNGTNIDVLCAPNPQYDANGNYLGGFGVISDITELKQREHEKEKLIVELQQALKKIKTLSGLIPICSSCKKIRDDRGYWNHLDEIV